MRDLPEFFRNLALEPTRALFLAFDINAPFFDHEVLSSILSERLRDVTVVVDAMGLRHSPLDVAGTRKAGVYYRIESVRSHGGGLFHPKAVFLEHAAGVDVLIGSANLTWNGWCRNLEIVDALSFGEHGKSSARSAIQLADFLRALPGVLHGLSRAGEQTMQALSAALDSAAKSSSQSADDEVSQVFSSVRSPLLEQLVSTLPAEQIEQLVAISPFYDPANQALLEMARAFPKARVVAVKDGLRANDFDGRQFSRLGRRAELRQTDWDSHPRPLHAKALLMNTTNDAWCATGSANMTSPAWIKSVPAGGNVELVIVRSLQQGTSSGSGAAIVEALLADISSVKIADPEALQYTVGSAELDERVLELHVLTAEESDYRLRVEWVLCSGSAKDRQVTIDIRTQDRELRETFDASFVEGRWVVDVMLTERRWVELLDDEIAAVIQVMQDTTKGVLVGAAWLRRRNLLGQGPRALLLRHQLRFLGALASGRPEDLLMGVAALLEAARTDEDAFALDDPGSEESEGISRVDSASLRRSALRQPVRALVMPASERSHRQSRSAIPSAARAAVHEEEEDAADDVEPTTALTAAEIRRDRAERLTLTLAQLPEVLIGYVTRSLQDPTNERIVTATAGALLAGLRASAICLRQGWLSDAAVVDDPELELSRSQIRSVRQRLWQMAFSIDGWEVGTCNGWFPRIALTPAWTRLAPLSVQHPAAVGALLVDFAADLVNSEKDHVPPGARFALQRLTGLEFPLTQTAIERFTSQLLEEGSVQYQAPVAAVLTTMATATAEDLPGWERLRRWLPVLDVAYGRREPLEAVRSLDPEMAQLFGRLLARPNVASRLVGISLNHGATLCGRCNTALSAMAVTALRNLSAGVLPCEGCGGVLIPISIDSALSRWVLGDSAGIVDVSAERIS
jgi:hypothetical protein